MTKSNSKLTNKKKLKSPQTGPRSKRETSSTKADRKSNWFNIFLAVVVISGMVLQGVGFLSQARRKANNPATVPVLTLHREGGATSLCQDLTIFGDGKAKVGSCNGSQKAERTLQLSQLEIKQLSDWMSKFKAFDFQLAAQSERPSVQIAFLGKGSQTALAEDQQTIDLFVESLADQATTDPCISN